MRARRDTFPFSWADNSFLRGASIDQISTTVATVLSDYFKASERTIFWNDELKRNVDPFVGLDGGFFLADWDFKVRVLGLNGADCIDGRGTASLTLQLKILRQLVELQLCHNAEIKAVIDRAWGVSQNKHKKKDASTAPPEPSDPKSQDRLQLVPIGQDLRRTRYWVADGPCTSIAYRHSLNPTPPICVYLRGTYFRCQLTRRPLFAIPWSNQLSIPVF